MMSTDSRSISGDIRSVRFRSVSFLDVTHAIFVSSYSNTFVNAAAAAAFSKRERVKAKRPAGEPSQDRSRRRGITHVATKSYEVKLGETGDVAEG